VGQQAPGNPSGVTFGGGDFVANTFAGGAVPHVLNDLGQAAFIHHVTGVGDANAKGIWAGSPGALNLIARNGLPAPGTGGASFLDLGAPVLNASGTVAFSGAFGAAPPDNGWGIWVGQPGALQLAVRTGDAVPGVGGATFIAADSGGINSTGQIAFRASFAAPGAIPQAAIFAGAPGGFVLAAQNNTPAPGTSARFAGFTTLPAINDRGEIAFVADTDQVVAGEPASGLWAGTPGALRLLALAGQPAPVGGTTPARFRSVQTPWLNDAGQVGFFAELDADNGSFTRRPSLWVADPSGELHLIARVGGSIDLGGGEVRTLQSFQVGYRNETRSGSTTDGWPVPLNDAGQFAFFASLGGTDSAILVATVPVPEPPLIAACAAPLAALLLRPRRAAT
jgi:hypothetical protein